MKSPREGAIGRANHRLWLHEQKKKALEPAKEKPKAVTPKLEGSVYSCSFTTGFNIHSLRTGGY